MRTRISRLSLSQKTHKESRAHARMYHIRSMEDEESLDVIAECPITIRGIPFTIDLYVLRSCEFDLILVLDWLGDHQAWVDCYNRRLYLRGLDKESILLIDTKPTSIFATMALQEEYDFGLPSMHVVFEFFDFVLKELPGLPPTIYPTQHFSLGCSDFVRVKEGLYDEALLRLSSVKSVYNKEQVPISKNKGFV
ncbi:hypothetical protein GQ457_06G012620 [Hibiscus cannabinus]